MTIYDAVRKQHERITELEKKITALETYKQELRAFDSFEQLAKRIEKLFKTIHGIAPDEVDGLQERIKKLEGVLRELLYWLGNKDINWTYKDEKVGRKEDMHKLIKKLKGNP